MTSQSLNDESQKCGVMINQAINAFRSGEPVLIRDADDREGEVDMVYPSEAITPNAVSRLRNDAGGLICTALSDDVANSFELPFLHDAIDHPACDRTDREYGDRPSFSLSINHRDTYTGITDKDRALTITALAEAAERPDEIDFPSQFKAPGHVQLLRAAPTLLDDRRGHTEFGVALAKEAGITPAVVVCEMLDDESDEALSGAKAKEYAEKNNLSLLSCEELVDFLG